MLSQLWHCHSLLVLQRETALLGLLVELMVTEIMYGLLVFDKVIQKQIKLTLKIYFQAVKILDKLRFFFPGFHRPFSINREIEISHSDISWDVTQELSLYRDLNVQQRH